MAAVVVGAELVVAVEVVLVIAESEVETSTGTSVTTRVLVGNDNPVVWGGEATLVVDEQAPNMTHRPTSGMRDRRVRVLRSRLCR